MLQISAIDVFSLRLPMKQNFLISGGSVGLAASGAPHIYVRITGNNGLSGWGEARPSPRWSYETPETVIAAIETYWKPRLLEQPAEDLLRLHRLMDKELAGSMHPGHPIARAAVDTALHDLLAQSWQLPLSGLWQSVPAGPLHLSYLISTDDPEQAASKAREAKAQGYRGVDVKIGIQKHRDVDILEAVKQEASDLFFRVDANQAYSLKQAVALAKQMERIGVDVFEQPMPASQLASHRELRGKTSIPIALDESIWSPAGLLEAIRNEACDVAVIKLTKLGGLRNAKLCGELAREAGLGLLGGGLTESKLGFTASAHVFKYLEITDPVDLNGPFFLADDPIEGDWPIIGGAVILQEDMKGLGCRVDSSKLSKYSMGM
ncbi:mandelate racemase/muconate lactonizing enzyme family protein [Paenibacillus silviterrae]|uniref:mandelate racemase/muconate lactonizing enzyme family protein n=1 Tax=Paenibacillus silviterrae TaxID=3242194 RepID=UPI0025428695|nr:enolase C-terminal domain-like protein [Paenibacillus chinjuensis]